eukprot:scaffold9662_cov102-Isochrysis_galbana.AAC.3
MSESRSATCEEGSVKTRELLSLGLQTTACEPHGGQRAAAHTDCRVWECTRDRATCTDACCSCGNAGTIGGRPAGGPSIPGLAVCTGGGGAIEPGDPPRRDGPVPWLG